MSYFTGWMIVAFVMGYEKCECHEQPEYLYLIHLTLMTKIGKI